jgi:hypothetical protein
MSLLSMLAQQIATQPPSQPTPQAPPSMGQRMPMPSQPGMPMPNMPSYQPPQPSQAQQNPAPQTFAPDATQAKPQAKQQMHPHWWGRLILGQGEFAPGTFLGTAADLTPPTMGLRAGASMAQAQTPGQMAMAALPLIPGEGEVTGLVHDIAPPAKAELEQLIANQAQHEGPEAFRRATSAGEKLTPEDVMSTFEQYMKKKDAATKALPNY